MKNDARPRLLHRYPIALIALLAFALPSCVDFEQDIWLADDGSGRVVIKFAISKPAQAKTNPEGPDGAPDTNVPFEIVNLQTALAENPNVTSFEVTEEESETVNDVVITMDLEDITKMKGVLTDLMSDSPAADAISEFSITRTDEGTYKIAAKLAAPGGDELGAGAGMLKGMMADAGVTFRIHADPVSHNGTEEGDAVVWEVALTDLMGGKGLEIEGEFEPAGLGGDVGASATTFWIVLASVLLVALVLYFVFRAQRPKLA